MILGLLGAVAFSNSSFTWRSLEGWYTPIHRLVLNIDWREHITNEHVPWASNTKWQGNIQEDDTCRSLSLTTGASEWCSGRLLDNSIKFKPLFIQGTHWGWGLIYNFDSHGDAPVSIHWCLARRSSPKNIKQQMSAIAGIWLLYFFVNIFGDDNKQL